MMSAAPPLLQPSRVRARGVRAVRNDVWSNWTGLACVLLHASAVVLVCLMSLVLPPEGTLLCGGFVMGCALLFLLSIELKKAPYSVSPLSLYFGWTTFAIGFAACPIAMRLLAGSPLYLAARYLYPADIRTGYLIALIGSVGFHAGMQWLRPKTFRDYGEGINARSIWFIILGFYVVGIVAQTPNRYLASLGTLLGMLTYGSHTGLVILGFASPRLLRVPEAARALLLLFFTALLVLLTAQGMKSQVVWGLLPLFLYLNRRTSKARMALLTVAAAVLYVGFIAPVINGARLGVKSQSVTSAMKYSEAFDLYSPFAKGLDGDRFVEQTSQAMDRFFECSSIGFIVMEVRYRGFLWGETFKDIGYALVPRVLWPEKPVVTRGAWFTAYLGFSSREEEATTATGMDAAGELYWNFGVPGAFLGMLLLGAMFGLLWRMAGMAPFEDPVRLLLYISLSFGVTNMPEAASRYVSCIAQLLVFGAVLKIRDLHKQRGVASPYAADFVPQRTTRGLQPQI
jgi:hypothetical protein